MDHGLLSGSLGHSTTLNGQMWKVLGVSEVKRDSMSGRFQAWKALPGYQPVQERTSQSLGWE